jgi:hypothetical protein
VFKSFEKNKVRYIIIGGISAILHGVPRTTFDLDILIQSTPQNAKKLLDALMEANFGTVSLTNINDLLAHEVTIFEDRVRIDVQTSTPGLHFNIAWKNRITMKYKGQKFFILSKKDLIKSKIASGREIDLEDVRLLKLKKGDEQ